MKKVPESWQFTFLYTTDKMHKVLVGYFAVQMAKFGIFSAESLVFLTFHDYIRYDLRFMKQYKKIYSSDVKSFFFSWIWNQPRVSSSNIVEVINQWRSHSKKWWWVIFLFFPLGCLCKVWFAYKWINFQGIPKVCRDFFLLFNVGPSSSF